MKHRSRYKGTPLLSVEGSATKQVVMSVKAYNRDQMVCETSSSSCCCFLKVLYSSLFSNSNVHTDQLYILLKCRFELSRP